MFLKLWNINYEKIKLFYYLASLSAPVFADPTVFKMELGKTTESEVKEMYSTTLNGVNIYTDGNQYYIDTKEIDLMA